MLSLFAQTGLTVPDITHPQELLNLGRLGLQGLKSLIWVILALGGTLALASFADRYNTPNNTPNNAPNNPNPSNPTTSSPSGSSWLSAEWLAYSRLLGGLRHAVLIALLLTGFFFSCSTLANRYHHWEQAKIGQVASSVAGDLLEQPAPQLRYVIQRPYTDITYVDGKPIEIQRVQDLDQFLPLSESQVDVVLDQATDPATERLIYQSKFQANYRVTNTLSIAEDFFFEPTPPFGYSLLQDYVVKRDNQPITPENQGEYRFPLRLNPGESTQFQVSYQAQGATRWVYSAGGRVLSKLRLTILANFPNADFASGIRPTEVPTDVKASEKGQQYTWVFNENVSVRNPFGVFTATQRFRNTGVLPRVLLLAPGVLLGWLLLLYLSVPMRLRDTAIAATLLFATLLTLTYASRLFDARLAWGLLLPLLLAFGWGLGRPHGRGGTAIALTLGGAILPVIGLLVPYTGLTLSLAALVSVGTLLLPYWRSSSV